jgi:hypothetical protein
LAHRPLCEAREMLFVVGEPLEVSSALLRGKRMGSELIRFMTRAQKHGQPAGFG